MTRMMCALTTLVVLAATLGLAASADAQDVTVEQLVALALERSPELQASRTEIAVAGGQVTQAALRPNPLFSTTHEHEPGGMMITGAQVEWPLDLFRRPARVAVARSVADAASLTVRDRERLLASAVREQAGRVLAARRTVDVTTEALMSARRMRELLDRRVTEGGSTKLDANLAGVEALRLEADAAIAAGELEGATIELKALVGLEPDAPLMLRDSLEGLVAAAAIPRLTPTAALEARSDLREAIARIAVADARIEDLRRTARYDVSVVGGWARNHWVFPQLGLTERGTTTAIQNTFHTYTVGATVTLPFANRNQGALASAEAERQGADALFTARQRAARAEIDAALAREREARRAVDIYGTTVRDLARQNVDVMLEAYDLGRFPLSDVLAEQRRYLAVEAGYTEVLSRAYQAQAAVARAFGEMP
jgi:cobalt-zinc-cadmium efflux system outer membrane protein